jgi:hypothetical protein
MHAKCGLNRGGNAYNDLIPKLAYDGLPGDGGTEDIA